MKEIVLSWPAPALSPNARFHWGKKASAVKAYRREGWYAALEAGVKVQFEKSQKYTLFYDFYPPANYRYDDDNLIGRMKAGRDGIADALQVDDRNFKADGKLHPSDGKGRVVVTLKEVFQ